MCEGPIVIRESRIPGSRRLDDGSAAGKMGKVASGVDDTFDHDHGFGDPKENCVAANDSHADARTDFGSQAVELRVLSDQLYFGVDLVEESFRAFGVVMRNVIGDGIQIGFHEAREADSHFRLCLFPG